MPLTFAGFLEATALPQPLASLVAAGATRDVPLGWTTSHRGPLAIYAARPFAGHAQAACAREPVARWLPGGAAALPRGAVIALAQLVDVQPAAMAHLTDYDPALGELARGQFIWQFADVTALTTPIPVTGDCHLHPSLKTPGVLTWTVPLGGDFPALVPYELYQHYEQVARQQRCVREHGPGCNQTRCLGFSYFSNGTEFDIWFANWCDRCKHDAGYSDATPEKGCPLLAAALCGERIPEWLLNDEDPGDPARRVMCLNFRDRNDPGGDEDHDPTPIPPPPGQHRLFDPPPVRRRMLVPLPMDAWAPTAQPVAVAQPVPAMANATSSAAASAAATAMPQRTKTEAP
jgi:hypothetical protein